MMTAVERSCFRYDDTELDEDSLRIVKEELNETDENKKKCLDILKEKLMENEDLNPYLHEDFLLIFLRVSKYDYNKAYQRVIKYYEEKRDSPAIFDDYSPSSVKIVETARQLFVGPYRMKDNSAILIVKRHDYNPSEVDYDVIIRAFSLVGDLLLQHRINQMCGFTIILDLKSSSWNSWAEYSPARLKLVVRLVQKSIPSRIRRIHVINAPSIYYVLYSIAYPFLSSKMRNRIVLHKNCTSLQDYIDSQLLPEEYGGELDHSDLIDLFERLYEKEDFFRKFSKYGFVKRKN